MSVVVRPVGKGASVSDWIRVPAIVHADDPHFVREIDIKVSTAEQFQATAAA
jgi:hypothetical protein